MKFKRIMAGLLCLLTVGGIQVTAADGGYETAEVSPSDAEASAKLENKIVKYICHYEIKQGDDDLFKTKYGGKLEWYPTTWNDRYSDLATYVLADEGIDIFPYDAEALPNGIISGVFQPVDSYINLKSSPWNIVKNTMEIYNFKGKHYNLVTNITAENVVIYNKKTIKKYGLADPYKLWKSGKWNWDTFEQSLETFVDNDKGRYGLDGWSFSKALYLSAGTPVIGSKKGTLTSYMNSSTLQKAADFGNELYEKGLVLDKSLFDWNPQPQLMGEGNELYYITGMWEISGSPDNWSVNIPPEDLGIVPVPSPKGSENYMGVSVGGFTLCKGADNPKGAARYAECCLFSSTDADAIKSARKTYKDQNQWSAEVIKAQSEINSAARKHPVIELAEGMSRDIASLTSDSTNGDAGIRGTFNGRDWKEHCKNNAATVKKLIKEVDDKLTKAVKKKKK